MLPNYIIFYFAIEFFSTLGVINKIQKNSNNQKIEDLKTMKETLIRSTLRERIEKDIINRKEQMRNMSYADKEQMRNIAFAGRDKRMQLINQLDYEKGIEWFNRGVSLEEIPENYKTNKYFAKVMIFQLVCVVVDLILVLFAIILTSQWSLFYDEVANECIAAIGILLVLHINFEGIWEMKSFIFNVFQLFNLHAYSRLVQLNKAEKEK